MRGLCKTLPKNGIPLAIAFLFAMTGLAFAGCIPEQLLVPTLTITPAPTRTRLSTHTSTPTHTQTVTSSPTITPTDTATVTISPTKTATRTSPPPLGIGIDREKIQAFYKELGFQFDFIGYQGGEYVVKAFSPTGFTRVAFFGEPDYLTRAEIEIITTGEAARSRNLYWMSLLDFATSDGARAADRVWDLYIQAASIGRVETVVEYVKIVLEVTRRTFKITILPNQ